MSTASESYYSTLLLVSLVSFFFGAMFYRIMVRYPFGQKPITGKESLIGKRGVVYSMDGRRLSVRVDSLYWNAKLIGDHAVKIGDIVLVKNVENLTLIVEPEI